MNILIIGLREQQYSQMFNQVFMQIPTMISSNIRQEGTTAMRQGTFATAKGMSVHGGSTTYIATGELTGLNEINC